MKKRLKAFIQKCKKKSELRSKDAVWTMLGGNCFGDYPPSYYHTHTQEEIQQRRKNEVDRLKEILRNYEEDLAKNKG